MLQLTFVDQSRPPVWLVKPRYSLGSAPSCDLCVSRTGIMPHHMDLVVEDDAVFVEPLVPEAPLQVDGRRISRRTQLVHGSVLLLASAELRIIDPKRHEKHPQDALDGWYLQSKNAMLGVRRFQIEKAVVLGRSRSCGICLTVSHLSREHARLSPVPGGVQIEDLGSSNGTFLNGRRISKVLARAGDEVAFDTVTFELTRKQAVTPASSEPDFDSTRLRPAIGAEELEAQLAEQKQAAVPQPSLPAKSRAALTRLPQEAGQATEPNSAVPLIVGICVVLVATSALLLYLMV